MAAEWYFLEHGTIVGPLTTSQFRAWAAQGRIDQNTSVRRGSQGKWIPAERVKGLFDAQSKSDPSKDEDEERESEGGMSRRFLIGIISLPVIAVIVALVFIVMHNKSQEHARIEAANVELRQAVTRAQTWLANGKAREADDIESGLVSSLSNERVTEKADAQAVLQRVQARKAEIASDRTLDEAKRFLDQDQLPTALAKLKLYFADPRATKKHEAQKLMNEIDAATSPEAAISTLVGLSDAEYQRFRQDKQLQDGKVTHPALAKKRDANLISALPKANVMREEIKRKAEDERLAHLEAERRAQDERDRLAKVKREEQEEERRRELAPPPDGTDDFGRIAEFYEKHVGKKYYFKGLYDSGGLSRDRDRKLFSVSFSSKKGAVTGGPYRDRLSFIATEAMAEKLLDVRKGGVFHAIVYVRIKYLDESARQYPVGYITKIEFTELDLDVVREYVRVTVTDDGNGIVHENPFKKK